MVRTLTDYDWSRSRATEQHAGGRNGRRCGLKILCPTSYVMLPNDTSSIYRRFSRQSMLTSCVVSLGDPRILHASLDQRKGRPALISVPQKRAYEAGSYPQRQETNAPHSLEINRRSSVYFRILHQPMAASKALQIVGKKHRLRRGMYQIAKPPVESAFKL